jgi:hypothetical protein
MILEFDLDYKSSSLVYEKIFLRSLQECNLHGKIIKEHFDLKLYVESDELEKLEEFATYFSSQLPHSIFLHKYDAKIVDEIPEAEYTLPSQEKLPLPFCPKCLGEVMDSENSNYYNIFTECDVCGYGISGENRSYKSEFEKIANDIKDGKTIELNTFYGKYYVAIPSKICNSISFDIIVYDLATIQKYANVEEYELKALASFEKPLVRLKKKLSFSVDFEDVETDLIRFKLPDDFILHLLMEELHKIGIDTVFITKDEIESQEKLILVDFKDEQEPIEVVVSEKDIAIVSGTKGLPEFSINSEEVNPALGSFFSVIKEHNLNDENIAGVYLSREYQNNILVYGKKYGVIQYLSLNFEFSSMKNIFEQIIDSDENGVSLVNNYKNKFSEHFNYISEIKFENSEFNIFKLWGVVSMILDYSKSKDPFEAAKVLEKNALSFLGKKGPRIDYKLQNKDKKVYLDPLMTIRTAMSFRLAGIDPLMLSYGVLESFLEFIANELDELKQSMNTTAITVSGSLLSNKHIFSKMSKEISINHDIYFNNELPVDGINMFYGGSSLE